MDRSGQYPLFTPGGLPYGLENLTRELRFKVCQDFADVFGRIDLDEPEPCPVCAKHLMVTPHPASLLIYCDCGHLEQFTYDEIFEEPAS